ncbi:PEP-CTERM sorting domain-containing protein [Cerasicoccus fimbriatus]|uniref:PEP-CTERM sorting domain-containing protein n=1 Tax=Cerasicoccus fimbriatus TaxID=3014554 RepID=UPI0022B2D91E|nr:PEP-CTERM sorting domain-containing protein [Cerasicoccus sp. TK19100]
MLLKTLLVSTLVAPSMLLAQTVLINFGGSTTGQPETWNNFSETDLAVLSSDLLDTTGTGTGIQLETTDAFYGINGNGTTSASAPYPSSATGNSFYDANSTWGSGSGNDLAVLEFSGLDVGKTYSFTLYASRIGPSDNRSSLYTLQGENSGSAALNATGNITSTVTVSDITPTAGGLITLTISPDAANNNSSGFIYLGVVEMTAVPEPATVALGMATAAFAGCVWLRRRRR